MWDIVRDSAVGQVLRLLSIRGRLTYPEETPEFEIPAGLTPSRPCEDGLAEDLELSTIDQCPEEEEEKKCRCEVLENTANCLYCAQVEASSSTYQTAPNTSLTQTTDPITLVTWISDSDQENPQNWSSGKKAVVAAIIYLYTFSVYTGVSIYVASVEGVREKFHVDATVASLGLSLYILACGIGPLIFSPLSEIPIIGRNKIYTLTFTLFVLLNIPTALAANLSGFLVPRFLLGFLGSPILATGGASLADIYSAHKMPYAIALWAAAATCGPAVGPVMASFAVQGEDWRWSSWELLWLSAPVLVMLLVLLPETSSDAILLRRARRLRRRTGRRDFMSQSELNQRSMTARQVVVDALIKPVEINALDPAVLFTTLYTALVYGISYSFFESFPLVYTDVYRLDLGQTGLTFLVMVVALAIGPPVYCAWTYLVAEPAIRGTRSRHPPEALLLPGVLASGPLAVGLFLFAWTARDDISLFASLSGVLINQISFYMVMQSVLLYVAFSYPKYAASLFAANDFARSTFAAGAVLFARPMFVNLGVDWGVTLLACLAVVCVGGMVLLYVFGAKWRERSRFAVKPDVRQDHQEYSG